MSNIFKSNTRFSSLIEENDEKKSQTNNRKTNIIFKDFEDEKKHRFKDDKIYSERRFKDENEYKLKDKEKIRKNLEKELDEKNFPILTLCIKENISEKSSKTTFIDKLTNIIIAKNDNTNEDNVPLGWVIINRDKKTNKTIMKYGESNHLKKNDSCLVLNAINNLICLHEKRSEDYVNLWGEDNYEKMFIFPNHDYDYFERLDQIQEEELKQQISISNNEMYDNYNDYNS